MSVTLRKASTFTRWLPAIALVLCLVVPAAPVVGSPDDTDRDLSGFDSTMVRNEKARRAVLKGQSYLEDGSLDQARECFNEALRYNQELHEARFCLGLAELKAEKYKLAIAHFKAVYERHPRYEKLRLELARCYLASGDCKQAGQWLKRHLEINESDKESGKLKKAIEECTNQREKR
jgi:tetratricopeptide (TPR) repeat protein